MKEQLTHPFAGVQPIHVYTRAQALAEGCLIDLSTATDDKGSLLARELGFQFPIAITQAAFAATVLKGGKVLKDGTVKLRGCQSLIGRIWDVLWMLRCAIGKERTASVLTYSLYVSRRLVKLKAVVGLGDHGEPVITLMLPTED